MESNKNDLYIVPYDFTVVTEESFQYSLNLVQNGGGKILLVHIVKEENQTISAKLKLDKILAKLDTEQAAIVNYKVVVGNIFDDLGKTAELLDGSLIVMGSHGATGLQKIFKSNALKVISHSSVPFVITQENQNKTKIENIVMPFSFAKESIQVTRFAASLAKKYDATIHLVGYRDKDEYLLRDMKINQAVVKKFLIQNDVKHDTKILDDSKSSSSYQEDLMTYAQEIDADLIATAYFSTGIKELYNSFLQHMIANEQKIPVFVINAQEVLLVNSNYSFLTI